MKGKPKILVWVLSAALACSLVPGAAIADDAQESRQGGAEAQEPVNPNGGDLVPGVIDKADPEPEPVKTVALYRMYNAFSGEHFYTVSEEERDHLIDVGWFYEGIGWQSPETSNTPVYRLYNPYAGDHHYTTSVEERDMLVNVKWISEGVGWYSDDAETVPVFRQYNPYAATGTHNFTYSNDENDNLIRAGWRAEGTSWYATAEGKSESMTWFSRTHLFALADFIGGGGGITPGYNTRIEPGKANRLASLVATDEPVGLVAINARTGKSVALNADFRTFSASSIKAPFIAALCKYRAPNLGEWVDVMKDSIRWSSNEAHHALVDAFGVGYEEALIRESNFNAEIGYSYGYLDITPRELAKLWITIRAFIISNEENAGFFRSLFDRGYFKEGWMYSGSWCGQMHHIGGVEGDVIYGIMSGYYYDDGYLWQVRDAAIDAVC